MIKFFIMAERKPLVYAPGIRFTEYVDNCHYTGNHDHLIRVFEQAGFEFHFFQPNWHNPHPLEWASSMAKLATRVAEKTGHSVVMAGFSVGGLAAVLAADLLQQSDDTKIDGLVGCSFSPWFGLKRVLQAHSFPCSDLHDVSDSLKASLSKLELPKIGCPTQLYAGIQEIVTIHEIRGEALAQWPQAEAVTPPCGHNVFHESYLQALSHNVGRLALPSTA